MRDDSRPFQKTSSEQFEFIALFCQFRESVPLKITLPDGKFFLKKTLPLCGVNTSERLVSLFVNFIIVFVSLPLSPKPPQDDIIG